MARRIHAGRNRVVAGEGQRRKNRNQRIGHRARRGQPVEARCVDPVDVIAPEPVERDEDDVIAVDDLRVVGAARTVRSMYRDERLRWSRAGAGTAGDAERDAGNDRKDAAGSHDRCYRGSYPEGRCTSGRDRTASIRSEVSGGHRPRRTAASSRKEQGQVLGSMSLKRSIHRLAVRLLVRPYIASRNVPIVAITGTNGKTTSTRLLEKIYLNAGFNVGSCSTYGVSHSGVTVSDQDESNARGAWRAARCRDLDLLILETARGGLISYGLGFRTCQVSIVTNLHDDHLGFDGVHTLAEMAEVKGLLPRNTASNGVVVLNGDDPHVRAMADHSKASPVYFVMESDPERYEHVWWVRDGWITRRMGGQTKRVIRANDILIASGGLQSYNIANAMAVLAAIEGLRNFISIPDECSLPDTDGIWQESRRQHAEIPFVLLWGSRSVVAGHEESGERHPYS